MKRIYFLSLTSVFLLACAEEKSLINDIAVPIDLATGYEVIEVDGHPEIRLSSFLGNVVPFVEVECGVHEVKMKHQRHWSKHKPNSEVIYVNHKFESGITYRLAYIDNKYVFVSEE